MSVSPAAVHAPRLFEQQRLVAMAVTWVSG